MFPSQIEFLRHILDECVFILKVAPGKTQEQIFSDEILGKAIVRSLEIIGEATKRVDEKLKSRYPQVHWKDMAGMRDRLIHNYFGVDYDIVYHTIMNEIPELHYEVIRILALETGE